MWTWARPFLSLILYLKSKAHNKNFRWQYMKHYKATLLMPLLAQSSEINGYKLVLIQTFCMQMEANWSINYVYTQILFLYWREGEDRGWDGWMASPTQWTWVWVNSGSWWWTGRPGMLQSMVLQRVGHDWATLFHLSKKNMLFSEK